jgi:lipoate-protein ligase A
MNMAIDEALVHLMGPDDPPILRFFDWSRPAISIGYSQRINEVLDVKKEGIPIVRRPTGGGVVFHGTDVTYSVVLPKRFDVDIKDVYNLIQSWIKNGLEELGLKATQYKTLKKGVPGYCSKTPTFGDIMIGDSKVGGLAGRRIRQRILCQGYLNLESYSKEKIRGTIIDNWCGRLKRGTISDREEELASNLCENKYSKDEWNFMR